MPEQKPSKPLSKGVYRIPEGEPNAGMLGVDFDKIWSWMPHQQKVLDSKAVNILQIGGAGSGKSACAMMIAVQKYCMLFPGVEVLILRKTFGELQRGMISDFKKAIPSELYTYHESKNIATFHHNGSKIHFGHLASGKESDLATYLSSSFPLIIIDECSEFSTMAGQWLANRNRINPGCEPNPETGEMPVCKMIFCSNPRGSYWPEWRSLFVEGKPVNLDKDAKQDRNKDWWVPDITEPSGWRPVHIASRYDYIWSVVKNNPYQMADADYVNKLNLLPPDLRKKMLLGDMYAQEGQYFDTWDEARYVIDPRTDKDAIIWQPWQPKVVGFDWGRAHAAAMVWMTLAEVRQMDGTYKLKKVVYRERVLKGLTGRQLAKELLDSSKNPDGTPEKLAAIYFSHEQFANKWEEHSPAQELSMIMMANGQPAVTRGASGPGSRAAKASHMYSELYHDEIVFLRSCPQIISAIPSLDRDEKDYESVKKTNADSDDVYDSLVMGLYGHFAHRQKPKEELDRERIEALKTQDEKDQLKVVLALQKQVSAEKSAYPAEYWNWKMDKKVNYDDPYSYY